MASSLTFPGFGALPRFDGWSSRNAAEAASASAQQPGAHLRPEPLATRSYTEVDAEFDPESGACWCWMNPIGAPSFTPGLLRDMSALRGSIRGAMEHGQGGRAQPVKHLVLASRVPGIFNLGGDLTRFASWIRLRDRKALTEYAYACVDVLHDNAIGFGHPIITVALVQGDALGGGFETALSCHVIVAERGTKFGFPEILFNLFPGMGAYSLLTRRVGPIQTEKMISSGRLYTAEELHEIGLVHVLAEPGEGVAETGRLLARNERRHNGLSAMHRAARRISALPYEELRDVVDIWVDAALGVDDGDLRKMERLTAAQNRRSPQRAAG